MASIVEMKAGFQTIYPGTEGCSCDGRLPDPVVKTAEPALEVFALVGPTASLQHRLLKMFPAVTDKSRRSCSPLL